MGRDLVSVSLPIGFSACQKAVVTCTRSLIVWLDWLKVTTLVSGACRGREEADVGVSRIRGRLEYSKPRNVTLHTLWSVCVLTAEEPAVAALTQGCL